MDTVTIEAPPDGRRPVLSPEDNTANVRAQMEKVLNSATFIRSKRLGKFLRFTIDQFLDGHQGTLKEYLVGVEVFNKLESFDPRIDSIVRVEARRLRSKLERYYATEGQHDDIVIQIRKGSYVPVILTRDQLAAFESRKFLDGRQSGKVPVQVSPFANLSTEASHQYICTGITEDLISSLTKNPQLQVMARSVIHNSDDYNRPRYNVEGSVRKQGERVRISVQVIDNRAGYYIWSETYERDTQDVFAVQDEICRSIIDALNHHLGE